MFRKKLLASVAALLAGAVISSSASAAYLTAGQTLYAGQTLLGNNGAYFAAMQTDGNFVVYRNDNSGHAVWSTNTTGLGADHATMQEDGNFVLYTSTGRAIWDTKSNGPGRYFTVDNSGRALVMTALTRWSSNTATAGAPVAPPVIIQSGTFFQKGKVYSEMGYDFTFQNDGNMVLYHNGVPIWSTGTNGATEADFGGNLVISDQNGVRWGTGLAAPAGYSQDFSLGPNNAYIALQSDGNLVIVQAARVWGTDFDFQPAPGGDGPICVGDPTACVPWYIPYHIHF